MAIADARLLDAHKDHRRYLPHAGAEYHERRIDFDDDGSPLAPAIYVTLAGAVMACRYTGRRIVSRYPQDYGAAACHRLQALDVAVVRSGGPEFAYGCLGQTARGRVATEYVWAHKGLLAAAEQQLDPYGYPDQDWPFSFFEGWAELRSALDGLEMVAESLDVLEAEVPAGSRGEVPLRYGSPGFSGYGAIEAACHLFHATCLHEDPREHPASPAFRGFLWRGHS